MTEGTGERVTGPDPGATAAGHAVLSIGSNLGDRLAHLRTAADALGAFARSPVYETDPRYLADQPDFLNMAVCGTTELDAADLLARLKALEVELGRRESTRFGPRPIDLDILFYGDEIIDSPGLVVPHPRLAERVFVLRPLADIAPLKRHPVSGKTVSTLLDELTDKSGIRVFKTEQRH